MGRPPYPNDLLLPGILRVLRSGQRWRDLDLPGYPSGVTHWRRLRFWERKSLLWRVWRKTLSLLFRSGLLTFARVILDGTLIPSFSFKDTTGYSGKHHRVGTKVVTLVTEDGIPLTVTFASGQRHDLPLARPTLRRLRVGRRTRPDLLLGDKGFDDTAFRRDLRRRHIRTNIPERQYQHRRKRGRPPTYDKNLGKERYVVERTNGWLKSFRRIHFRYDVSLASFRAFFLVECIVVGVRKLIV